MKECPKCKNLLSESAHLYHNCRVTIEQAEGRKKKYQNQSGDGKKITQTDFSYYYDDIIHEYA